MKAADFDGDGRINYDEFMTAAYNRQKLLNQENLTQAFISLDRNSDGTISRSELM